MPLYDRCPHRADIYLQTSGTDPGGGTQLGYTLGQAAAPCWAPSVSSSTQERFGQDQIVVQHKVCFKVAALTVTVARGAKLVVLGKSFHVTGINYNQAAGNIPELLEVTCEELL